MAKNNIEVKILGDAKGLIGAVGQADGALGKLSTGFKNVAALAATMAVAAGAALVALGTSLDGAVDNIIVGTGATGDALKRLEDDFKAVVQNVPTNFGNASTAIADLNTRLGLTGEPLQEISTQFLELSRLTKTDVATNIKSLTRVFGDSGVAAENQGEALDKLFRLSQASGIGISQLGTTMVQFGAPLRQLGFGFETAAALIAKFEKEGVNTEAVMSGLKIGLGKLSAAGEEPAEALARVSDEIKNAGSAGEANAIAIALFGQRAGPDMAAAIREGRFEIDDLVSTMEGAEGAILDTAKQTESWQQKLTMLKNKALIKLAPVAEKAFDMIGQAVEDVTPYLEKLGEWLEEKIPPLVTKLRDWFQRSWPAIKLVVQDFVMFLQNVVLPVVAVVLGAIVVIAKTVVEWFLANWPSIRAAIALVVDWLVNEAWPVMQEVFAGIQSLAETVVTWFETNWPAIQEVVQTFVDFMVNTVWPAVEEVLAFIMEMHTQMAAWVEENWDDIKETIDVILGFITEIIEKQFAVIKKIWEVFDETILNFVNTLWNQIKVVIESAIKIVQGVIETVMAVIRGDWSAAWEGIKTTLAGVWDLIAGTVTGAIGFIKDELGRVLGLIASAWQAVWDGIAGWVDDTWESIKGFVSSGIDAIIGFVAEIPGRVASGIGSGFSALWENFKTYANKIVDGWNSLEFTLPSIDTKIPGIGKIGGQTVGTPNIPRFHEGGAVGSLAGKLTANEVPAILQQGEFVLSRKMLKDISNGNKSSGPTVQIDKAYFNDGQDAEMLAATINFKLG